jgi:hypothetical protein
MLIIFGNTKEGKMKKLRLVVFVISFQLYGCVVGLTGANQGKALDNGWIQYDIYHPGLTITAIESSANKLVPISTVGKTSPMPLRHTITFGPVDNPRKLEIVGRYHKDVYLDGQYYGGLWMGDIVINEGVLSIDGKIASVQPIAQ